MPALNTKMIMHKTTEIVGKGITATKKTATDGEPEKATKEPLPQADKQTSDTGISTVRF